MERSLVTAPRRADVIAVVILTSLITLFFIDVLAGANSLFIGDTAYFAYPDRLVLRTTVLEGNFPSWNRWISGGQPLAANPVSGVFYPLTWLILLPSFELGFHWLLLLHLYLAGWAMYALLRSMQVGAPSAFFGALSFALGGLCVSLVALHPLFFPLAWLPLVCLYARRFLKQGRRRDLAMASLFLGVQALLGEPTILLQSGVVLGLYALHAGRAGGGRSVVRALGSVATIGLLGLLVGAVQLLPAVDLARDSVRADGFTFERVTSWSFPPARVGEMLHPNLLGHSMLNGKRLYWGGGLYPGRGSPFARSIYPGLLASTLALAGVLAGVRGRWVMVGIFASSLLLAFGANTPLWQWLYSTGLARSIRYPERFVFMGVFAVTVFGAVVLDRLLAGDARVERVARGTVAAVALLFVAGALLAMSPFHAPLFISLWHPPAKALNEMLTAARSGWILAAARAALLFLILRNLPRAGRTLWLGVLGVAVILDLALLLPELTPRVSPAFYRDPPLVARRLPADRESFRLFHIGTWRTSEVGDYFSPQTDMYWIHRNALYWMMPATWDIRTVLDTDYTRTALKPTGEFVDATWALSQRRADWLRPIAWMSNAWFTAVNVDPAVAYAKAGGQPVNIQPVQLIELDHAPRYYFADRLATIRNPAEFVARMTEGTSLRTAFVTQEAFRPAEGRVHRVEETANRARIEVETTGKAFLVMSVTPHKYWSVSIDGAPASTVVTNLGYQGVVIPEAGRHVVAMRYRNPLVLAGAALSLATLLGLALLALPR